MFQPKTILFDLSKTLREKAARDPSVRLVKDGSPPGMEPDDESTNIRVSTVAEGDGEFFAKPIPYEALNGTSEFTHFLDGIQNWRLIGYSGIIPLIYGYTSAVIRKRDQLGGLMSTWKEPIIEEHLLAPRDRVDLSEFDAAGIPIIDTARWLKEDSGTISQFQMAAREGVAWARSSAETRLADDWGENGGAGWLMVDGRLMFSTMIPRAVGVIKSHRTHFFPPEEQFSAFQVPECHRTCAFLPGIETEWEGDAYSWYMRLRSTWNQELTYGLIRVEVMKSPEMLEKVDEISKWILSERNPISAPDERWDRLLYPIHDCEFFLRTFLPSIAYFEALFG